MKIVVFGASGRCGGHFVRLAASHGHEVTAVVREGTDYDAPDGVRVVRGDVLDPKVAASIVPGHDAVASALGMRYAHPWAKRQSPDDFTSRATANIVAAMRDAKVARITLVTAAGVGDSRAAMSWPMRAVLATSNVGVAYADLDRVDSAMRESGLDWQTVRPTTLTNASATGHVVVTSRYRATDRIPREDVAAYMLLELEAKAFTLRAPMITS